MRVVDGSVRCTAYSIVRIELSNERSAFKILARLKIYHPYGFLGLLPGQEALGSAGHLFGSEEASPHDLITLAKGIRTYSEQVEEGAILSELRNGVFQPETIIFLGFAFHQQNMRLLSPT